LQVQFKTLMFSITPRFTCFNGLGNEEVEGFTRILLYFFS